MAIARRILIWIFLTLLLVGAGVWGFLSTGGIGLVRLYQNYLSQDIPDKQYTWRDFTDRGPRERLSGYYAWGDSKGVYIWTLSGLKRFADRPGTSVYYYRDTCAVVRNLANGTGEGTVDDVRFFDIKLWREQVNKGDYVWLVRVGGGVDRKVIDKIFANSKQTFPLDAITLRQCEE